VRGIADLLIIDDDGLKARVVDYKTGNDKYPDRDQLTLMSLMVFAHFPHIRQVNSALLFVVKNSMVTQTMTVEEKDFNWWRYRERVAKLAASYDNDVWNPYAVGAQLRVVSLTPNTRRESWQQSAITQKNTQHTMAQRWLRRNVRNVTKHDACLCVKV
jgi:hypothetical protein